MATPPTLFIASRGSPLALAQANLVLTECRATFPEERFEIKIIKTTGDKLQSASLAGSELPKGLFTKEIEEALLAREADLAVHSLKDLPTELPPGLKLGAVSRRVDVRDVLVYRDQDHQIARLDHTKAVNQSRRSFRPALTLQALPHGATLATSSTRRNAQALEVRPDLRMIPIRGNVGTRLKKFFEQSDFDATILAAAGLERLCLRIAPSGLLEGEGVPSGLAATPLALAVMLPCPGQAALGIEIRGNDPRLDAICAKLDHAETHQCVAAERSFLSALGGGCHLAVAAYGVVTGDELRLRGVSYLDGQPRRGDVAGARSESAALGRELAERLRPR
jgi:hydroxymethylbilane synthase